MPIQLLESASAVEPAVHQLGVLHGAHPAVRECQRRGADHDADARQHQQHAGNIHFAIEKIRAREQKSGKIKLSGAKLPHAHKHLQIIRRVFADILCRLADFDVIGDLFLAVHACHRVIHRVAGRAEAKGHSLRIGRLIAAGAAIKIRLFVFCAAALTNNGFGGCVAVLPVAVCGVLKAKALAVTLLIKAVTELFPALSVVRCAAFRTDHHIVAVFEPVLANRAGVLSKLHKFLREQWYLFIISNNRK